MKKMLSLLLALTMVFALAACASKTAPSGSEAEPAEAAEDGQNPIMNFVGNYACGRASILVEADGADGAKLTVNWGSSAAEHSEWTMSGKFDPDTLTIEYVDGVRRDVVFAADGSVASETVVYENGFGTVHFDNGDLYWKDDEEHVADDMVFANADVIADYSAVTAMNAADVELFAGMVRTAFINADWETLAEYVRYPITVDGTELADAAALVAFLGERTVSDADREAMMNESCHNLFFNGQGICLGDGEIWLLDSNYGTDAEPQLQIIAINGITK